MDSDRIAYLTNKFLNDEVALAALEEFSKQQAHNRKKGEHGKIFIPTQGPQTEAYYSKADILLFGGSPGGGKTALEIGLGLNEHRRTLVMRKQFNDLDAPIHTLENILRDAGRDSTGLVQGQRPKYRMDDDRIIVFMGLGDSFDGRQGLPFDLLCCDEVTQFTEEEVRTSMGWLRADKKHGIKCRAIFGTNPPKDTTGDWVVDFFAPWLDERYPNPAKPGELRWFNPSNNDECDEHDRFMINGIEFGAQSRTFIPSKFTDNPYYDEEEYARKLASLPDSIRERFIAGDFMKSRPDDEWQLIPTAWVNEAINRWKKHGKPDNVPLTSVGVDIAQGGADETTICRIYGEWVDEFIVRPGSETPDGPSVAGLIFKNIRGNPDIVIDMGGGYGGDTMTQLRQNGMNAIPHKGAAESKARTKDKTYRFFNKRSEAYWKLREAFDPSQEGGAAIMIPDDPKLKSDLCTLQYSIDKVVKVETKKDVVKRIGRSTDRGDALAMAWSSGTKQENMRGGWGGMPRHNKPNVVVGHENKRRRK